MFQHIVLTFADSEILSVVFKNSVINTGYKNLFPSTS